MTVTIADVMRHVRNYFMVDCVSGAWGFSGGVLTPAGAIAPGTWVAFSSPFGGPGVWQLDERGAIPGAADTQWEGDIFLLNPPADFLHLCEDIASWAESHSDPAMTGERFGQYSRTLRPGAWQSAYREALAPYRHMFPEVKV